MSGLRIPKLGFKKKKKEIIKEAPPMYRDIATKIAWHYLGTPYLWGGDNPKGFDCSGLCIEILKSVGKLPAKGDWTAAGLFEKFKHARVTFAQEGCLVFWGRTLEGITHIEYCLNEDLSIGASGGGSKTKTIQDAFKQDAYIKVRPIRPRAPIAFVDPFAKG
jgi:cell wall-associated NlpC family hydrolase